MPPKGRRGQRPMGIDPADGTPPPPEEETPPQTQVAETPQAAPIESPAEPEPAATQSSETKPASAGPSRDRKQRTFYLPADLLERVRSTVAAIAYNDYEGEADTMAGFVERALEKEVARVEAQYNEGTAFRPYRKRLPSGPGRAGAERMSKPRKGVE